MVFFVLKRNRDQIITVIKQLSQRWKTASASLNNGKPRRCSRRSPDPLPGFFLTVPSVFSFSSSSSLSPGGSDWSHFKSLLRVHVCPPAAADSLPPACVGVFVCVWVGGCLLRSTGPLMESQHLSSLLRSTVVASFFYFLEQLLCEKLFVTPGDKYRHKDREIKRQHKECITD